METNKDSGTQNQKKDSKAFLVCEGALCKCDAGAKPAKLSVINNTKVQINEGKHLATDNELTFNPPAVPFGSCKNKPGNDKSCSPAFVKWEDTYSEIEALGAGVVTDKSKLRCTAFGGTVTVIHHGQTQFINKIQKENVTHSLASQMNVLMPKKKDEKKDMNCEPETVQAEVIDKGDESRLTSQKRISSVTTVSGKNEAPVLKVRSGEEVKFAVKKWNGNEALISWRLDLPEFKEPFYFLQEGKEYKTKFTDPGVYSIEAYGTGADGILDADTEIYKNEVRENKQKPDRIIKVEVKPNKLTGITHDQPENMVVQDNVNHVRTGVEFVFEPVFEFPPFQEEIDNLVMIFRDAAGAELHRTEGQASIVFSFTNTATVYKAEAYLLTEPENKIITEYFTAANSVSVIGCGSKSENCRIRPGETLSFSVKGFKFKGNASEEVLKNEHEHIKWHESDRVVTRNNVATGLTYKKTYHKTGKYVIKCTVKESSDSWFKSDKNHEDDWRFEVTENYITSLESVGGIKAKVGKTVTYKINAIFQDITPIERDTITWKMEGPRTKEQSRGTEFKFHFPVAGRYQLVASMNGRNCVPLIIDCIQASVIQGFWTDQDGNFLSGEDSEKDPSNTIGFSSWGQDVCVAFRHVGLEGEKMKLEIWDKDMISTDDCLFSEEITVSDKPIPGYVFKLSDDIRDKAVNISGSGAELYFTLTSVDKDLKVGNAGAKLPIASGKYLYVDNSERVKAYFSDRNDAEKYAVADHQDPVYAQIKTTGLQKKKIRIEIWEKSKDSDVKIQLYKFFKVDNFGMASIPLKLKDIKMKNPNDTKTLYIKVFKEGEEDEIFSSRGKYELVLYKVLKSKPHRKGITKALVVVENFHGSCQGLSCLKIGDKSELIQEINIRLAGFGGNIPTLEFTQRTELMIKQFQRDYMNVKETGRICGNTLKAIDEFSNKWKENISDYICLCNGCTNQQVPDKCTGFGKGRYENEYSREVELEKYYNYEYPGIHRSLLWGVSGIKYYLSRQNEYLFNKISSGYRCWDHNKYSGRNSTNHMGKAVDIQFKIGNNLISGKKQTNIPILEELRDKIFVKLNAKYNWKNGANNFSLEPFGLGIGQTWSWIHLDVREFNKLYLQDKYFIKSQKDVIGCSIEGKANEMNLTKLCHCNGDLKGILASNKIAKISLEEARVRAFMTIIRIGEGTIGDDGYHKIVGGKSFIYDFKKDWSDHPKIYVEALDSTAAGAYQITKKNWNDEMFVKWRNTNNIKDFSPAAQDMCCFYLIKFKKPAYPFIVSGKIREAIGVCRKEWASLPGAGYGQREENIEDLLLKFNEYLELELSGKSQLHVSIGFIYNEEFFN